MFHIKNSWHPFIGAGVVRRSRCHRPRPTDETVARELEAIRAALKDRRDAYDSREAVLLQLTLIDGYATKVLAAEAREGAAAR